MAQQPIKLFSKMSAGRKRELFFLIIFYNYYYSNDFHRNCFKYILLSLRRLISIYQHKFIDAKNWKSHCGRPFTGATGTLDK